jgi:EAL domain-containing protein (putative c-di-GMP-specific phosphodiesterase class I)
MQQADASSGLLMDGAGALMAEQFCPVYQPRLALDSGMLSVLTVRGQWNHPQRGRLEEEAFIADVTSNAMSGCYLLALTQQAAVDLCAWQRADAALARLRLALPLAAEVLADLSALGRMLTCLQGQGVKAGSVIWQVSEAVVAAGEPTLLHNLNRLNLRGFAIGVVHCGRFDAQPSQFACCPLTELTLDCRFAHAEERGKHVSQLEQLQGVARQMDIGLHGDGIQSRTEWNALRAAGYSDGQGPLVGPFMTADDFLRWLRERQQRIPLPMADVAG